MNDEHASQFARPLRIRTALSESALLMTDWSGEEALSTPFSFKMKLASEQGDVDFAKLLGSLATVAVDLPGEPTRYWNGVITRFCELGQDEDFTYYDGTLEPSLALLRNRAGYRIFQDRTVDEIIDSVLVGVPARKRYSARRNPRNYCVQFGESDLQFFHRLMEEEGLFYFFEHDEQGHTLVLCDDSLHLDSAYPLGTIEYSSLQGGVRNAASITAWTKSQSLVPTDCVCQDAHFQLPQNRFASQRAVVDSVAVGSPSHKLKTPGAEWQIFAFPGGYAHRHDSVNRDGIAPQEDQFDASPIRHIATEAETEARIQAELLALRALRITGASDVLRLAPGAAFSLTRHYSADGKYLVVQVAHHVQLGVGWESSSRDAPLEYKNAFQCQPASLPYRPARRTQKPLALGVQTATVVAPEPKDQAKDAPRVEQFYDKYGRIKVRFPWDRRPVVAPGAPPAKPHPEPTVGPAAGAPPDGVQTPADAADRSCWIRVAQIWAGNRWGAYFWPRAGHEVVVAFEQGDPERPVVIGSLYNAQNMPPMAMPAQQALAGIKSCSVGGNPQVHFNGFTFYDELGNEHLEIHSQAHATAHSEQSQHRFVRGTSVQVLGSMFGRVGSGSGGGPGASASASHSAAATDRSAARDGDDAKRQQTKNAGKETTGDRQNFVQQNWSATRGWAAQWLAKRFEADIEVVFGDATRLVGGVVGGSANDVVQGGTLGIVLDPSAWIDNDAFQRVQDLVIPLGAMSGLFGAGKSLHYGPSTVVRHGSEIHRRSSAPFDDSNPRTAWVGGIVTASTALMLLGWRLQKSDPKIWENLVRALGPRGATGLLFNLLLEYEQANGECDAGIEKQAESKSLSTHADALSSEYASLILDVATQVSNQGTALASQGKSDQERAQSDKQAEGVDVDQMVRQQAVGAPSEPDAPSAPASPEADDVESPSDPSSADAVDASFGKDDADVYQCYDGLLATGARHIALRARPAQENDADPSLIHIDAQGGEGKDNGVIAINSTGQATLVCGPACFQVRRKGQEGRIEISTGKSGKMTLLCGDPASGARAVLDPKALKLLVGPEGSGALISMASDKIRLAVGPSSSIEITASGITMKCGGNSVAVDQSGQTTKGLNVTHQAEMAFSAKGMMASLQGSAQTTVKGAITMIN